VEAKIQMTRALQGTSPSAYEAEGLLASSYWYSAQRIAIALKGGAILNKLSDKNKIPSSTNYVVGICGQGGRHEFFRVHRSDLEEAVNEILGGPSTAGSAKTWLEHISDICTKLRRRTTFSDRTGCTNDSVPAIVPLLPPEEIWLNGRELPLDVWRLIAFEFDLVSSGVNFIGRTPQFSFSSFSQAGLAFSTMMGRMDARQVSFKVNVQNIPAPLNTNYPSSKRLKVSLGRLFFEAGRLLTPLAEDELTPWYSGIRYLGWISNRTQLSAREQFKRESVDSRYRGLFAEEVAIGMMAIVLGDVFRATVITNTSELLPPTASVAEPVADFIARARYPGSRKRLSIIAESKGSVGSSVVKQRKERAKMQVATTKYRFKNSQTKLALTFCSSIFFDNQKRDTTVLVDDPPDDPPNEPNENAYLIDPIDALRASYAKTLRFIGMERAFRQVLRGEGAEIPSLDEDRQTDREWTERDRLRFHQANMARERFHAEIILDVGPCGVAIDFGVLRVLRAGIHAETAEMLEGLLEERSPGVGQRMSFITSQGIGCVFYDELN